MNPYEVRRVDGHFRVYLRNVWVASFASEGDAHLFIKVKFYGGK